MINILPPELKSQLNYSRRNAVLIKYLSWALLTGTLLFGLIGAGLWYANRQIADYQQTLAARQSQRSDYQSTETNVQSLQANLGLIEKLLNEKTHYSKLLADLASALPTGAYITHMSLTGDDKKPLELLVNVDSFNRAAEVRNGLISSSRIKSADIQTISENEEGSGFIVALVAAFEEGQAR